MDGWPSATRYASTPTSATAESSDRAVTVPAMVIPDASCASTAVARRVADGIVTVSLLSIWDTMWTTPPLAMSFACRQFQR